MRTPLPSDSHGEMRAMTSATTIPTPATTTTTPAPVTSPTTAPAAPTRVLAGVTGLGFYVPEKRLRNADFEKMVDTTDAWIVERTGIRERRQVAEGEATSDLAVAAARKALAQANLAAEDVDLIIVGTVTPDHYFPSTACMVQNKLGCWKAGAFDIGAACSGFIYALSVGQKFVESGSHRNVLVIGADALTTLTDYEDRNTCILFGDGAGAAILQPSLGGERTVIGTYLAAKGDNEVIVVPAGGTAKPTSQATLDAREHYLHLDGREVFRFATSTMRELVAKAVADHGYDLDDIGLIIPHQVNQRIIDAAVKKLGIETERVYVNIDRYGNTAGASLPIALAEAEARGQLVPGKLVVLCAFGAGLTWGYALLRW